MKFSVDQKQFSDSIGLASRGIGRPSGHPILQNLKIDADPSGVRVTGFDLSMGIEVFCPATVEEPGSFTFTGKLLADIVAKLGGMIACAMDGDALRIDSLSGSFSVPGLSSEEYPTLPEVSGEPVELPLDILSQAISRVSPFCSTEETKQILTGIHLTKTDNLELASTDGHRLSVEVLKGLDGDGFELTLPSRALSLLPLIAKASGSNSISMAWETGCCVIKCGDVTLTTRTVDGQYPNYGALIPADFAGTITVDRAALVAAIDRVNLFSPGGVVVLQITEEMITVSAEGRDAGSGRDRVACQGGTKIDIAFNGAYLSGALNAIKPASEVQLRYNTATSPVVLCPLSGPDYLHLVMPVQIRR